MSTRSGLIVRQPPRGYTADTPEINCLYCRKRIMDLHRLSAHEAQCDARFVIRRMWAMQIEKARRAER